jgi:hypothetical protein
MQVVKEDPVLVCSFDELFEDCWKGQVNRAENENDVTLHLTGKSNIKPRFRIPDAGGGDDLFFNSLELLRRFVSMPTGMQERFAKSIRKAMERNKVYKIEITVPWSNTGSRKLEVRAVVSPADGTLDFELR